MSDTVSVIIPAYNAAAYIARAVDSALAQTHKPLEVLVVDDGSADRTSDIVAAMPAPVRLIRKENGGPASARNLGARQAKGEWLALLDADDRWFPQKTEVQLKFTRSPDIAIVHGLYDHRTERPPPELTFDDLWDHNSIGTASAMMRRSVFELLGGFNEHPSLISVEDYNLWLRVAAAGWRIVTCPHIVAHYTQGVGISSNIERLMRASLFNLDDIEVQLRLPPEMVERKRLQLRANFGQQALHDRNVRIARDLLRQTARDHPTAANIVRYAASKLPVSVLDLKRNMENWVGTKLHKGGQRAETRSPLVPVDEIPFWSGKRTASIFDRRFHTKAEPRSSAGPMLVTTVDAEEDFDWSGPFDSSASKVTSMRYQHRAHRVFEKYGVVPVYMVDYPVASQDAGRQPLLELLQDSLCEIGAQLHPWVTPPFVEDVTIGNSYPGNLPQLVEYSKLAALTDSLEQSFGIRPRLYRAGRCGAGPNTGEILKHLGYQVDTSVMPHWNYGPQLGPDFRDFSVEPYWFDTERTILELPITSSVVGVAAGLSGAMRFDPFGELSGLFGVTAALARLTLMERIRLTPEGIEIEEAKRLVRFMKAAGHRVFVLTYHSPSLEPGNTPYVRTQDDLGAFLSWLDEFYDFFTTEVGGTCVSWRDVRAALLPR